MYHVLPQPPVVEHTFPLLFQLSHHICHLYASYTPQLEGLHLSKGLLQFNNPGLNAIAFLSEDLEAVDLCYN